MKPLVHHFFSKHVFKLALFCGCSSAVFAQETPFQIDIDKKAETPQIIKQVGIKGGLSMAFADVSPGKVQHYFALSGKYFFTPYLNTAIDIGFGNLSGGEKATDGTNADLPYFSNSYYNVNIVAQLRPIALIQNPNNENLSLYYLSGIYVGAGVGFIKNNTNTKLIKNPGYGVVPNYTDPSFQIPVELGYEIPIARFKHARYLTLDVAYRWNFTFDDNIDGHKPTVSQNESNDVYGNLTLGIYYRF